MTAALEGGECSAARPGRTLPPGKTRYPLYRRLGGPQGRSERAENLVPPTGIRSRTVQPVVSHCTDWAVLSLLDNIHLMFYTGSETAGVNTRWISNGKLNNSYCFHIQSGPKKCIHSLLINIFGINLNEISISGSECNKMFSQQVAQALL